MTDSDKQRLVFLFGSGISYKAGMPSMDEITKRVLSGEGIYYDGENFSCRVPPFVEPAKNKLEKEQRDTVQRIAKFLNILQVQIDDYYHKHKFKQDINYEDLYYMTRQIYDSQAGEYDNPAIQPLVDNISYDISPLLVKAHTRTKWTLSGFAKTAIEYIEFVVSLELKKELTSLNYLDFMKKAYEDRDFSRIDIFTLNHDIVLEEFLKQKDIRFTDGFFKPEREDHRYWKPSLLNSASFRIRLFKLHGSITWFRFRPEDAQDWTGESTIIPSGMDIVVITDSQGKRWWAPERKPKLLVGTYNKILDYHSGIYTELHCQLYHSLSNVKQLLICGYGLGDRGINTQVVDWIYSSDNRRIILIDPAPEALKNKINSISNKWDKLLSTNKLTIIPKGIEEISWQDIKGNL